MKDYLKEIKDRLEKATPGSWEWIGVNLERTNGSPVLEFECKTSFGLTGACPYLEAKESDKELIANAPSDLAKLVKVVELYEQVLKDECYCIESWNGIETCYPCEEIQKAKEIMGGSDD